MKEFFQSLVKLYNRVSGFEPDNTALEANCIPNSAYPAVNPISFYEQMFFGYVAVIFIRLDDKETPATKRGITSDRELTKTWVVLLSEHPENKGVLSFEDDMRKIMASWVFDGVAVPRRVDIVYGEPMLLFHMERDEDRSRLPGLRTYEMNLSPMAENKLPDGSSQYEKRYVFIKEIPWRTYSELVYKNNKKRWRIKKETDFKKIVKFL